MRTLFSRILFVSCIVVTSTARVASTSEDPTCFFSAVDAQKNGHLAKHSGDESADRAMAIERKLLLREYRLRPGFFFLSGKGSSNAFADFETLEPDTYGTVAFGIDLMKSEVRRSGGREYTVSIPAIMGHEFAHLLQHKSGTVIGGLNNELQADYLAGWYIGRRSNVPMKESGLRDAVRSFFENGDYNFNDPLHHGTPEQRAAAVQEGYGNRTLNLRDAYDASLKFAGVNSGSRKPSGALPFSMGDFEATMDKVMKERDSRFANLRGPLDGDSKATWVANLMLPEAKECTISWRNEYQGSYDCTMFASLDEAVIMNDWKNFLHEFQRAYVSDWKATISEVPNGKMTLKSAKFTSPAEEEISLRLTKTSTRLGYEINLTIPFDNY
jgi:hypothetical protein